MSSPEFSDRGGEVSPSRHSSRTNARRPIQNPPGGARRCGCTGDCRRLECCLPLREESWRELFLSAESLGSTGRITRSPQVMLTEWSRSSSFVVCPLDSSELVDLNGSLIVRPDGFSHAYAAVEREGKMLFRSLWFAGPVEGHTFRLLLTSESDVDAFSSLAEDALRMHDFSASPTAPALVPLPTRMTVDKADLRSSWSAFANSELAETWAPGFPHLLRRDALAHVGMDLARPVNGNRLFDMLDATGFAELPLEVTVWSNGVRHQVTFTQECRTGCEEVYRCAGQQVELHLRPPASLALWLIQPGSTQARSPHLECFDESARLLWRIGLGSSADEVNHRHWRAVLRKLGPVEF